MHIDITACRSVPQHSGGKPFKIIGFILEKVHVNTKQYMIYWMYALFHCNLSRSLSYLLSASMGWYQFRTGVGCGDMKAASVFHIVFKCSVQKCYVFRSRAEVLYLCSLPPKIQWQDYLTPLFSVSVMVTLIGRKDMHWRHEAVYTA